MLPRETHVVATKGPRSTSGSRGPDIIRGQPASSSSICRQTGWQSSGTDEGKRYVPSGVLCSSLASDPTNDEAHFVQAVDTAR